MSAQHWMTFATFSEQEFFTYPSNNSYDGVVLNANMVAHAPAGIAAFLLGKVSDRTSFLIDPMTHAFQHNPEFLSNGDGSPKSSMRTLAAEYGETISSNLGVRPINSGDVVNNVAEICDRVLSFQWNYLAKYFEENNNAKYMEGDAIRRPAILVSPYFYLTEENIEDWIPVLASCAEYCVSQRGQYPANQKIYSAIVVSRGVIQAEGVWTRILESLNNLKLDGVLFWVDGFDESHATTLELDGFIRLCRALRGLGLEVLNLHGGYFSCLASSASFGNLLTAVSHGPEFGESRGVVPVGGGIPISRFYVPDLHVRLKFRDFLPIAIRNQWLENHQKFYDLVCDCQECKSVISSNVDNFNLYGESEVKSIKRKNGVVRIEFPVTEAKKRCLRHYLCRKVYEYEFVQSQDRDRLLANLQACFDKYSAAGSQDNTGHLIRWRKVLDNI